MMVLCTEYTQMNNKPMMRVMHCGNLVVGKSMKGRWNYEYRTLASL